MWIGQRKEIRKLTFRALALRRSESRNRGLCVLYIQKCGAMLLLGAWQREKQQNKLVEWKPFVDTVRIKSADLKINFCPRVLRLSVLPWCRERTQTAMCCIEWFGRLKCLATGLDAFLSSFSTSRRCSRKRSPSRLPVSPIYNFLQVIQQMTLAEVQVKWSVILIDRLGPDNSWQFVNIANERTCFASCPSTSESTGLFTCLKRTSD